MAITKIHLTMTRGGSAVCNGRRSSCQMVPAEWSTVGAEHRCSRCASSYQGQRVLAEQVRT